MVTYSYIQFEYKVQSSGINGNFVVSWIVIYCWAAGKLMISIICRIHSRSLPKFNQFLSGPQNLSIPQSSQKCTSIFLSYANKQTNTETDKQRWKQNPCQNWQSDGVNQRSYSTPGLVSTGMGDRLQVGKPPRFVTSHSGQLSLPSPVEWKMSTG